MYNQQASSYYGKDVRTGSGLLKMAEPQAVNPRLSKMALALHIPILIRILNPTFNHNLEHMIRTSRTAFHNLLVP
jgi:hypothetical protein